MLANRSQLVKEVHSFMCTMLGRLLRRLLRLGLAAGAVAAVVSLVRRTIGGLAGEPGTPRSARPAGSPSAAGTVPPGAEGAASANGGLTRRQRGVPMSFDSWPPVPPAPHRAKD
jgi:hypothetical protein